MALPSSGIISMSMVNIEIGDDFNNTITFTDIATEFNLSSPNYGDSQPGLSISELYGLAPVLSASFSDFGITQFNISSQDGSVDSAPVATTGGDPVPSVSVSYLPSGIPYSEVLSTTTRTANVTVTVPSENHTGNTYQNAGQSITGQVNGTQNAYEFEFNDWTGTVAAINCNTGKVSYNVGTDGNAPAVVTNNQTFSQIKAANGQFATTTPGALQFVAEYDNDENPFGVLTGGSSQLRSIKIKIGVPGGSQDGGSGTYGNQGTVLDAASQIIQFAQNPQETLSLNPTNGSTLTWTSGQSGASANQTVIATAGGGDSQVTVDANIRDGHTSGSGGLNSDFGVSTTSVGPFTAGISLPGNNNGGTIYVAPTSTNTDIASNTAYIVVQTESGHREKIILLTQEGNVTFTTSPADGSTVYFNDNGTLKSGDNTIDLTTNTSPPLNWSAAISSAFKFYVSNILNFNNSTKTGNGSATFTTGVDANTGARRTGTLVITCTHSGVINTSSTINLQQDALEASGDVYYYDGSTLNTSIGSFGATYTVSGGSSPNCTLSPAFVAIKVVANYAVSFDATISSTQFAELDTSSDSSGSPSGGSHTLSNQTAKTSTSDPVSFFLNFKQNQSNSDRTITLQITFDDDHTSSNTTITYTVQGCSGGVGGDGGLE